MALLRRRGPRSGDVSMAEEESDRAEGASPTNDDIHAVTCNITKDFVIDYIH